MTLLTAGLLRDPLPPTKLDRSAVAVRSTRWHPERDADGYELLAEDLGPRCVLPQREEGLVPRDHHTEPTAEDQQYRIHLVHHQVSEPPTDIVRTDRLLRIETEYRTGRRLGPYPVAYQGFLAPGAKMGIGAPGCVSRQRF